MPGERPVILLADDDPALRLLSVAALDGSFEVVDVEDGLAAVEQFQAVKPELVVLDVMMPGLDGFQSCQAIRRLPGGDQLPIVIMTGLDDDDAIERAYEAGATDFLPKPVHYGLLVHRIRYLLRAARTAKDLMQAERKVAQLAYFDPLTALPNRSYLESFLAGALQRARHFERPLAVLALDVDLFKRVNDTFGHAAGDAVLCEVAKRITACIRSSDMLALSPSAEPGEALESSSDGSVAARLGGDDAEALLGRADAALYHAKESGRNAFHFFTESIHAKASRRTEIETRLRGALMAQGVIPGSFSGEAGAIEVHFQPKIALGTGEVVGFEALLRWSDPKLGRVPPNEFVPICEDTGLIVPVGDWVLRRSCAQARQWADEHVGDFTVAVNLSARQFREPDLAARVGAILTESGLAPSLLELELTESILLQDTPGATRTLNQLKALGMRIALDDFGTGYSSLSYLAQLPIDTLKIDRSFVRQLGQDSKSDTITAAIIALSRSLHLDVVAEGVETTGQLRFLASHGCGMIQGFLYGKAMPPDQIASWWATHDRDIRMSGITPWVAAHRSA